MKIVQLSIILIHLCVLSQCETEFVRSDALPRSLFKSTDPICYDIEAELNDVQYPRKVENRQFGLYESEGKQHLLWGADGKYNMYEYVIDYSPLNTSDWIDENLLLTDHDAFSIIEIHDIDGNNVTELLAVEPTGLRILFRNQLREIVNHTFVSMQDFGDFDLGFTAASLSKYVDVDNDGIPEILFSFYDQYTFGSWILSYTSDAPYFLFASIYIHTYVDPSPSMYGTAITKSFNHSSFYPDILVSDPYSEVSDGIIYIYTISDINFANHFVDNTNFTVSYQNNGDPSGFGNSLNLIQTAEEVPKLAVGSKKDDYFVVFTLNGDGTFDTFEYYDKESLFTSYSGFGKSVRQIGNINDGGSLGEIIVGHDTGFCLYFLDDDGIYPVDTDFTGIDITTTEELTTAQETTQELISEVQISDITTASSTFILVESSTEIIYIAETESFEPVESNTEKTEEEICTIIQGSCTDGGVVITPPTNTSNGVNITDDVTINQNTTIKGSNVTVTGSITITGSLDIDSSSLDIKNKIDVSGDLNVGNSVLVFSNNGGTIKAGGCVTFASDSEIKIELTDEEKKQLAKNGEGFVLIESDCFEGEEKFTDASSSCENGVRESIKVNEDSMSVIFENCLEPGWIVFIVALVVGIAVIFLLIIFLTPAKKIIFPHRYQDRDVKTDSVIKDERILKRLTVLDNELRDVRDRTTNLKQELSDLDSSEGTE